MKIASNKVIGLFRTVPMHSNHVFAQGIFLDGFSIGAYVLLTVCLVNPSYIDFYV